MFAMIEARRQDVPAMVATLAAAFIDDVALAWILPERADRHRRLTVFFGAIVRGTMANGLALTAPDGEAVTLWRLPGRTQPRFVEMLLGMPAFMQALDGGQKRAQTLSASLRERRPVMPFRYLQFAGVAPGMQGKGRGGAAVRAGLERARAAGKPVYLETFTTENVAFYRRLGFEVTGEWDVPDGPHVWSMLWQ